MRAHRDNRHIYKRRSSIYTQEGASEVEKVRGFKKMLNDIGNFKMKDVGELIFWEDRLCSITAFSSYFYFRWYVSLR